MIERDLALHTFPDGYQVVVETATNPGRKTGRINWNATVARFGIDHTLELLNREDITWKGGHPSNYGHDQPFVTTNSL